MTDQRPPQKPRTSVRRPARPPRKKKKSGGRFLWLVVIAAVAAAGWWFLNKGADEGGSEFDDLGIGAVVEAPLAGDRAVVLVFPEWDASGFVTEERQIPSRDRPGEDLQDLISVLCEGPRISGAISALPKGTRSLGAFVNPQDQFQSGTGHRASGRQHRRGGHADLDPAHGGPEFSGHAPLCDSDRGRPG